MARAPTSFSARQRAQQERNTSSQRRTEQRLEEKRKKRSKANEARVAKARAQGRGQTKGEGRGYNTNAARARAVAQGLLLASADEIEAGLRAGGRGLMEGRLPSLAEYYGIKDEINRGLDRYRTDMPGEAIGLEVAGAVLPTLIPGTQGATGSRLAALAARYPGRTAAARIGAESTAYGVGAADRPADIPRSVVEEGLLAAGMYGGIRAGGAAARKGGELLGRTRPVEDATPVITFAREEVGPFLNVRRTDLEPETIPEALDAKSIEELRAILADPAKNIPARVANDYTLAAMGRGYDTNFADPGTSLMKQSGIARTFREAAEGTPEYKSALFERYGEVMPEVVERAGAQNYDQLTEAAYRQLARETDDQFARLPVETRYHYGEGEYPVPSAMLRDILAEGRLNVFRGGDRHPYLSDVDPATGLTSNEKFRAVHDYFGHGTRGATFRPGGEELAYASHSQMMSPLARMALLSETRGQNSFVNYSPINADVIAQQRRINKDISDEQRMARMRGSALDPEQTAARRQQLRELGEQYQFAPQTPVLLPPEYLSPVTPGGMPDYVREILKPSAPTGPERAVHLSRVDDLAATDPSFYGTGHRGDDWKMRGRKGSPSSHTSFYIGDEGTVIPEKVVADVNPYAYETQLSNLYDIESDPEQLIKLARAYAIGDPSGTAIPDFTRMVREYGYSGYRSPFGPQYAANVFEPVELRRRIAKGPSGYAQGGLVSYSP